MRDTSLDCSLLVQITTALSAVMQPLQARLRMAKLKAWDKQTLWRKVIEGQQSHINALQDRKYRAFARSCSTLRDQQERRVRLAACCMWLIVCNPLVTHESMAALCLVQLPVHHMHACASKGGGYHWRMLTQLCGREMLSRAHGTACMRATRSATSHD